jgi:hypothetical protein
MTGQTVIYRYGPIAWVWRVLIAFAFASGALLLFLGVRFGGWSLPLIALPLVAPAAFFGFALAVRIDRVGDTHLRVQNLLFWPRRIAVDVLGSPKVRRVYHGRHGPMRAPAAWIPVRGRLPVYVDLLGDIADRQAFIDVLHVPKDVLPQPRAREVSSA